jgi:hypothetical protein
LAWARIRRPSSVYISQIERRERHASRKLRAKRAAALRVDEELLADDEPKGRCGAAHPSDLRRSELGAELKGWRGYP